MNDAEVKQMLAKLQAEFKQLSTRRDALAKEVTQTDRRLVHLKESIDGLKNLLAADNETAIAAMPAKTLDPKKGISEAIRTLYADNRVLSPTLIRSLLKNSGFEDSENFLVVIHNTLKRMAESGELRSVDVDGKTAYEMRGPIERILFGGKTAPRGITQGKYPKADAAEAHELLFGKKK